VWSREAVSSTDTAASRPAATCATCGVAGPLTLEAAALRGDPALRPFARYCSPKCFRDNWRQLRDLQAWALANAAGGPATGGAGGAGGGQRGGGGGRGRSLVFPDEDDAGDGAEQQSEPQQEDVGATTTRRVVLGKGARYIPRVEDIGWRLQVQCGAEILVTNYAQLPPSTPTHIVLTISTHSDTAPPVLQLPWGVLTAFATAGFFPHVFRHPPTVVFVPPHCIATPSHASIKSY
jgi:hypothetical protein